MNNKLMKEANPATRLLGVALLLVSLSACTKYEYHETRTVEINKLSDQQEAEIAENQFLDIGIVLFDPGIDEQDDESLAYANIRQSEAVWFSSQLKETLERSNAWGLVRALPNHKSISDVIISGRLMESNGETVRLNIDVKDAGGRSWYSKEYFQRASQYAYNPEVNLPGDPFEALFNEIANDLFDHRAALTPRQLVELRSISKVLFAKEFVPDAFSEYLQADKAGRVSLTRIPAASDPMLQRVERIRARNDLFLDVIQDYYRAFNRDMKDPYQEWRKQTYREVIYARQLKEQARKEKIAGLVVMAGGLAAASSGKKFTTRAGGHLATLYGSQIFANSFRKADQALSHSETLREMGASLEADLEPSVVDLQDRSVTLTGTVEDQYTEWRRILSRMFTLEDGDIDAPRPVTLETTKKQLGE